MELTFIFIGLLIHLDASNEDVKSKNIKIESQTIASDPDEQVRVSTENSTEQHSATFVLAPTPAQLGKAPLQRRQSMGNYFCAYFPFHLNYYRN